MAQHETYSLGIDTNFDSVLKANKAINAMYEGLKKVDRGFSGMHAPRGLPAEINHMSAVTASYVQRLESEGKTYEANKVKSKAYAESLNYLNRKQKSLETQLGKIAEKSGKTSETYKEQQVRINATATSINHLQKEMDKLHPTGFNKVTSDARRASKAVDSIKSHLHNAFDNIKVGAGVVTAGIGAIGASAISGAKKLASVQQNYKEITNLAVLGGEKQKEVTKAVKDMQAQGRDMSIKYGKSQKEIAAGYEDLVKRGYTTKQALGAMRTELQASVASGDQFSDVTTVSSQVLDAFGMRAKTTAGMIRNTKKAVNELAYSADATSTGFKDIGIGMSYVGTAAKANNISLAETASALGVLSNNGLESEKAGTALRATINGLTNQVNKIGKKNSIFDKLGIKKSEMLDAHGNLKSLSTDMGVLYKHIEEHSEGGSDKNGFFRSIFGTSGMNGAMILAKSSKEVEGLTKRTEEAGKSGTYVAKMAERNSATAQMQMARAKQATEAFKMELGAKLLPAINQAGDAMAKFLTTKDGKTFEKEVGNVVSAFANTLVNLIKFVATHKTTVKIISGGLLASYGAVKTARALSFVGGLYEQYKKLAGLNPKIKELGDTTSQLTGHTSFKDMTKGARATVAVSAVFDAAQIGTDFYEAATAKTATERMKSAGAGIGAILGGAIGGVVGGPLGAQIGVELGQAMGPSAAKSFGKAFSGHAGKYFVYGKSGSKSNGKYNRQVEKYTHDGYYTVSNHRIRGKTPLYEYDDNGYYNTKTHKYTDQRSLAERSWGMSHRLNTQTLAHPHNAWDVIAGSGNLIWNSIGHIGDKGFWQRSKQGILSSEKGTWLDWSGAFKPMGNRLRVKKGPNNAVAQWWDDQTKSLRKQFAPLKNTKIDWGPFNLSKWFKPQVHGKAPKKWQLERAGILPKINGKKWASGIVKDAQKGFKDFPKFTRDLGGKSSRWFKYKWKGMTTWGTKTKKDAQHGFKGFEVWSGKLSGKANKWFKSKWHGMTVWGGKTRKNAQNGFKGFEKWSGKLSGDANKWFKSKWKGMKTWTSGIHKNVRAGWNGFEKWLGNLGTGAVNLFKKPFEGLGKWVSDHIPKPVKAVLGGIGKGISWAKSKLTGKAHANGGKIIATHGALVGEAGPELAYKPYAKRVRLLGANGPQFTRVHAGEHILNARDTAKVLSGGLGVGITLKGYAGGTDKLKKTSNSVTRDYKDIADKSTKSLKKLARSNKRAFSQVNSDASKQTKQTKTRTGANFNSLHKNVSKLTARTKSESVSNFKSMHHGINKQMDAIHDGVISSGKSTAKGFGGAMDKMHKYAHSAMADTTRQLNKGISSIDKVLGQFGGNNSVIKPIKFAKGTDQQGRLTHNTLAMVNDATQGPRQEALVSPDNKLYLPKGQNVQLMLPAGWGVLNGTQTKQVTKKTINHFAKGTGISHSALRKLAEKANADPTKWFKDTYSDDIKQRGPALNKGTTALGSNSSTKYGNPWSNALWGVINKQIDSDDGGSINATGLLKAAEKYGEGHKYVLGATGPNTFDCSGLVMYTLKHAYGIDYPHFSGSQYNMTRHISKGEAHMGDLVFWGAGGSDHVGIYAGGNRYFSAQSPAQGIHMNTLDSVVGKGRPLFGRIKGMPSQKAKPKHQQKADSRIVALVKRELGSHALKWIKDNLGEEGGNFGNPVGDGVARWRKYIIRAASQMHTSVTGTEIAKILSMISSESSGNPTITQQIQDINSAKGTPAQGLLQFVPNTFNAFAVKGHHKLLNGYDQLLALFNDSNWRNDIHFGGSWGPSGHRRFAKGGRPKVGQNVIVGEHGPEIARFDSPVQIYSNEKSRRSLNLGKLPDVQHASSKKHFTGKFAPVININFNGSASDFDSKQARKIAEIVQRELEKVFNSIDEEFC